MRLAAQIRPKAPGKQLAFLKISGFLHFLQPFRGLYFYTFFDDPNAEISEEHLTDCLGWTFLAESAPESR